jgi:hypothetical protein
MITSNDAEPQKEKNGNDANQLHDSDPSTSIWIIDMYDTLCSNSFSRKTPLRSKELASN